MHSGGIWHHVFPYVNNNYSDNFGIVVIMWREGNISLREGAKLLSISHTTFSNRLKEKYFK